MRQVYTVFFMQKKILERIEQIRIDQTTGKTDQQIQQDNNSAEQISKLVYTNHR